MADAKKVLIVDDSAVVRQVLKFGLGRILPVATQEAADGQQALELAERDRFDLILCDINMPVLDGLAFLARIRERPAYGSVPVVMVTTEGDLASRDAALAGGASGYLTKPLQTGSFRAVLEPLLR